MPSGPCTHVRVIRQRGCHIDVTEPSQARLLPSVARVRANLTARHDLNFHAQLRKMADSDNQRHYASLIELHAVYGALMAEVISRVERLC